MSEAEIITKKALGEIAAIECSTMDFIKNLQKAQELVDRAVVMAQEDYYQSEVNKR